MDVALSDARNKLGGLIDEVASGKQVTLTRRGKAVARLTPVLNPSSPFPLPLFDPEKAQRVADEFRRLREGNRLNGLSIRELINEGRK